MVLILRTSWHSLHCCRLALPATNKRAVALLSCSSRCGFAAKCIVLAELNMLDNDASPLAPSLSCKKSPTLSLVIEAANCLRCSKNGMTQVILRHSTDIYYIIDRSQ